MSKELDEQPKASEQPDRVLTPEQMDAEDSDPIATAYAVGYADGYKARAIFAEQESAPKDAALRVAVEALEFYQRQDDVVPKMLAGFKATPDTVDRRSPARLALAQINTILKGDDQ